MPDLAPIYDATRKDVVKLLKGLSGEELDMPVPATEGWTIRNIATHLAADAACAIAGDFPAVFFESFGEEDAVVRLNEWTSGQLKDREGLSLDEILERWDESATRVTEMMRGEASWPEDMPWFADRVLLTDLAVHQQDIFGALGIEKERDSAQVKIGLSGYIATMGFRLQSAGGPALKLIAGDKEWMAGGDDPDATVSATRYEFFRAMSGRRSPDQIRAYDWTGDPEPFIPYFYPYGVRKEALVE
jgi:uncharacterized protein (TIGR03083 family)